MLKKIGSWIGTAKRYVNQIQEEVSIIGENDNDNEIKKNEKKKISKGEDDKN